MGRPGKKGKVPSSEDEDSQEEHQVIDVDESDEDEDEVDVFPGQAQKQLHQNIAQSILSQAKQSKQGQKMTWNALYKLKKKQIELMQQMNSAVQQIKQRYELLKQPLHHKISQVVLGNKIQQKYYSPQDISVKVDIKKDKAQKIQNFWSIVLDKQGLLTQQIDIDCISKINLFKVEMLDQKTNHIKIQFAFSKETQYFNNMKLEVQSFYDYQKNQPQRIIKDKISYKKDKIQHSIFTILFDSCQDINQFYSLAGQFYQTYSNALYFYFRQQEDEHEPIQQQQNEEQDEEVEEVKPSKKLKEDKSNKQSAQKPQCKNQ